MPVWTKEEDETLKVYFPIEGLKVKNRLTNKTVKDIIRRLEYLNIEKYCVDY